MSTLVAPEPTRTQTITPVRGPYGDFRLSLTFRGEQIDGGTWDTFEEAAEVEQILTGRLKRLETLAEGVPMSLIVAWVDAAIRDRIAHSLAARTAIQAMNVLMELQEGRLEFYPEPLAAAIFAARGITADDRYEMESAHEIDHVCDWIRDEQLRQEAGA